MKLFLLFEFILIVAHNLPWANLRHKIVLTQIIFNGTPQLFINIIKMVLRFFILIHILVSLNTIIVDAKHESGKRRSLNSESDSQRWLGGHDCYTGANLDCMYQNEASRCNCYKRCTDNLLQRYQTIAQNTNAGQLEQFCCKFDQALQECSLFSNANANDPHCWGPGNCPGHYHSASPFRVFLALGTNGALSSGWSLSTDTAGSGTDIDGCHDNAFSTSIIRMSSIQISSTEYRCRRSLVNNQAYSISIDQNNIFGNSDGSTVNLVNCVASTENQCGNSVSNPQNTLTIQTPNLKVQISNISPSSSQNSVNFECEDPNNPGTFIKNQINFVIQEPVSGPAGSLVQLTQRDKLVLSKSLFPQNNNCLNWNLVPKALQLDETDSSEILSSTTSSDYNFQYFDVDYIGQYQFKVALEYNGELIYIGSQPYTLDIVCHYTYECSKYTQNPISSISQAMEFTYEMVAGVQTVPIEFDPFLQQRNGTCQGQNCPLWPLKYTVIFESEYFGIPMMTAEPSQSNGKIVVDLPYDYNQTIQFYFNVIAQRTLFVAKDLCCVCADPPGGPGCVNNDTVKDSFDETCSSWYDANPSSCGQFDTAENQGETQSSNITVHIIGNITMREEFGSYYSLWQLVDQQFTFDPFVCSFGCPIQYMVVSEEFFNRLQKSGWDSGLQYDSEFDSVPGLKLRSQPTNPCDEESALQSSTQANGKVARRKKDYHIIMDVDTSQEKVYRFAILALAQNRCQVNFTSTIVTLDVRAKEFQHAPFFYTELIDQHYIYDGSQDLVYDIPAYGDDEGPENVKIVIMGMDSATTRFDKLNEQIIFSNILESTNQTLSISLFDKNFASSQYELRIFITSTVVKEDEVDSNQNNGNFKGIEIEGQDLNETVSMDEYIQMRLKPITRDGNCTIKFSERLRVPTIIQEQLDLKARSPIYERRLQNKTGQFNQTELDELAKTILSFNGQQYDSRRGLFKDDHIPHQFHLLDWTELEIKVNINFTYPLLVSQGTKLDKIALVIHNGNESYFVSKQDQQKTYDRNFQEPQFITREIPKQLPHGTSEEVVLNTVKKAKQAIASISIFQTVIQMFMKASFGRLLQVFITLQFLACLFLFNLSGPAIVEMCLEQMWQFINFSQFNPMNLWIFWSSFFLSFKSTDTSFQSVYEEQNLIYEDRDSLLKHVDPLVTAYIGLIIFFMSSALGLIFKEKRQQVIKDLKAYKDSMIWNGILGTIDICYIGYCIQFFKSVKSLQQVDAKKVLNLFKYIFLVFVSQILIIKKLRNSTADSLNSKKSQDKIGILTQDVVVRQELKYGKFLYPLNQFLKAVVIFTVHLSENQLIQLTVVNLAILVYIMTKETFFLMKTSAFERKLKGLILYMVSLCYIFPIVFVGKFVDSDENGKLEWEGFLKDEYIHYKLGIVQVLLFTLTIFLSVVNLLTPAYRQCTWKNLNHLIKVHKNSFNTAFQSQFKSKSTYRFDIIQKRMAESQAQVEQCLEFCDQFQNPIDNQAFILKYGHLPLAEQNFARNEIKLQRIKYRQLSKVLKKELVFMSANQFIKCQEGFRLKGDKILREQRRMQAKGVGKWSKVNYEEYPSDFLGLAVYEAMDLVMKEISESGDKLMFTKKESQLVSQVTKTNIVKSIKSNTNIIKTQKSDANSIQKKKTKIKMQAPRQSILQISDDIWDTSAEQHRINQLITPNNQVIKEATFQKVTTPQENSPLIYNDNTSEQQTRNQLSSSDLEFEEILNDYSSLNEQANAPNIVTSTKKIKSKKVKKAPLISNDYMKIEMPIISERKDILESTLKPKNRIKFFNKTWAQKKIHKHLVYDLQFDTASAADDFQRILHQFDFSKANQYLLEEMCKEFLIHPNELVEEENYFVKEHFDQFVKYEPAEFLQIMLDFLDKHQAS